MKILVLAPQPFFQERGTPIAVRMLLEVLAERYVGKSNSDNIQPSDDNKNCIEVLTYHEGSPADLVGVRQHRIDAPAWLKDIKPGISFKKIIADWYFFWKTIALIWSNRSQQFSLIHAIEESVFIAWFCKWIFGIPYVYDMDSSLSLQLTESWKPLRLFKPVFEKLEGIAIRNSLAVVPVCDSLAETALAHGALHVKLLSDVCTLQHLNNQDLAPTQSLRGQLELAQDHLLILYVGNLHPYQGVELLVESFLTTLKTTNLKATLAIVGGGPKEVAKLKATYQNPESVHFLGARPLDQLPLYLAEADILASPRTEGNNTPMKIYNYLASGKPIIATNIISHTQVLTPSVALLCAPTVTEFSIGLHTLITEPSLRSSLGAAGARLAKEKYTPESFRENVGNIYECVEKAIKETAA